MSKIGFGYGSEWQLLRYLGHHRNHLNEMIMKYTKSDEQIYWFDYPIRKHSSAFDGELKGVECFKDEPFYNDLLKDWKCFWPQTGNQQCWDGVFRQGDTWYFVEAKAHKNETHSPCKAIEKGRGRKKILKAFTDTCGGNVSQAQQWLDSNCYQLANRLAFVHFCRTHSIKAKLCYICFVSGYRGLATEVKDSVIWEKILDEDYVSLSLSDEMKDNIVRVYIDCYKC